VPGSSVGGRGLTAALLAAVIVACSGGSGSSPTPGTPTASEAATSGATFGPDSTGTPAQTDEASPTPTEEASPAQTDDASPTAPDEASPDASAGASPGQTDGAIPSAGASPGTSASPIAGDVYDNPVFPPDFPDPHVILVDGTYYAYSTNASGQNMPVISSDDLSTWQRVRDGLPVLPSWTALNFGSRWAPGVIQIDDSFVLYFVACDATRRDDGQCPQDSTNRQCIGVATSAAPEGPYRDESDEPLVCQYDLGGSIDAYPFRDVDGQLYLYWKNDGNCCGLPVGLWVQPLSDDGLRLTGEPTELIQRDQIWEIPLIENPAMVEHEGSYYLFYSGNWWASHQYAVGYAVCESATGPCEKPLDGPIFEFNQGVFGPGGQALFEDEDGDLVMAYHGWTPPNVGYPAGQRSLFIDPVRFENGAPVMTGPTTDPQPLP
jgi:beta-xylosidase